MIAISRSRFLLSCVVGLTAAVSATAVTGAEKPNIIWIFADDVGREVLGCYGGESYETPRLDQLAQEGVRFDNFYAAPVCHPSRIAALTGCYPARVGFPTWGGFPKDREATTLAQVMKQAGYATAVAGKWQLTFMGDDRKHAQRLGFDESCLFGWHEGPRFWDPFIWQNGELRKGLEEAYGPELYVDFLADFMKRNKDQPFFAFYSMALCHAVSNDLDPHPPHGPEGRYMTYAEMVADMDYRVGQIVDTVKELGLEESTLIFFTTDNGTTAKNYIRHEGPELIREDVVTSRINGKEIVGAKGKFSEWGICVPTIARWPGRIEEQTTSDALVDLTDLLPTFAELGGLSTDDFAIDGVSFRDVLLKGAPGKREWAGSQSRKGSCVRIPNWKLLSTGELFDLVDDPDEKHPIAVEEDTPASRDARRKMLVVMEEKMSQ